MFKSNARKTYPPNFKEDVVVQSEHCESIKELADDFGLAPQLIYSWRSQYKKDPQRSFTGRGKPRQTPEEQKIAQLVHKLAETRADVSRMLGIKKGHGHLYKPLTVIYEFMDNHKEEFSIVKMSQVLGVSRSGCYR